MTARTLATLVAKSMFAKKAHDVVMLDLRKLTSAADFFVVCSADSDVQVRAIADAVEQDTSLKGHAPWHSEGQRGGVWIVLDFVDVVAHIFHRDTRTFYNLERLWSDAKTKRIEDKPAKAATRVRKGPHTTKRKRSVKG